MNETGHIVTKPRRNRTDNSKIMHLAHETRNSVSSDVKSVQDMLNLFRQINIEIRKVDRGVRSSHKLFWKSSGMNRAAWSRVGGHLRTALRHLQSASSAAKCVVRKTSPESGIVDSLTNVN